MHVAGWHCPIPATARSTALPGRGAMTADSTTLLPIPAKAVACAHRAAHDSPEVRAQATDKNSNSLFTHPPALPVL
jgi:hypothetical protein